MSSKFEAVSLSNGYSSLTNFESSAKITDGPCLEPHFFRCALAQVLVLVNTDRSSANSLPSLLIHALHTAALLDLFTLIDRTSTYGVSRWGGFPPVCYYYFILLAIIIDHTK